MNPAVSNVSTIFKIKSGTARSTTQIKAAADFLFFFFPKSWLDDAVNLFGRLLGLKQRTDKRFTRPWNTGEIYHD